MVKKFIIFLIILGIPGLSHARGWFAPNDQIKYSTAANLPASPYNGQLQGVTDGASIDDCSTGSGSNYVLCQYNGNSSAWQAVGDGGGLTSSNDTTFGDGSSGDITLTFDGDTGTDGTLVYDVSEDAFNFSTVLKLYANASPTVNTAGDLAFDTDFFGSGRGTVRMYDGTAATGLVGILASDTCSNGEVPKFNTGGTWTCEADNNSAGLTGTDTYVIFFDGNDNPSSDSGMTYNKTTDTLTVGAVNTAPTATPTTEYYDSDATAGDVNAQIQVNCTDAGDGTEDCDVTMSQQISGAMTAFLTADADGLVTIRNINSIRKDVILPIQSAKLSGSFVTDGDASEGADLDASEGLWKLNFNDTTDEGAVWQFRMPANYSSTPVLIVDYSMASGTSDKVEFEGQIMCVSDGDSADIATASFGGIAVASATVPGTAGYMDEVSITLTDDSCAAGDMVWVYLSTDADDATNDNATGDREVVGVTFTYTSI